MKIIAAIVGFVQNTCANYCAAAVLRLVSRCRIGLSASMNAGVAYDGSMLAQAGRNFFMLLRSTLVIVGSTCELISTEVSLDGWSLS